VKGGKPPPDASSRRKTDVGIPDGAHSRRDLRVPNQRAIEPLRRRDARS
jgi:hypothetical protein